MLNTNEQENGNSSFRLLDAVFKVLAAPAANSGNTSFANSSNTSITYITGYGAEKAVTALTWHRLLWW
ncbi:hypothetical protein ISS30_02980 [bacterium]|nr:hypothetical protein [FCB group bacterium]MBL7190634.1 hypothetical protein [bacterium]